MVLNILKLCVGADSVEDLEDYIAMRYRRGGDYLIDGKPYHTTRMVPKRLDEIIPGGSLYWVIKGNVQARQRIASIVPFTGPDGIGRCNLVLERDVIRTQWQPRRAFQGWRYLTEADTPADMGAGEGAAALPPDLRNTLAGLGLL
ncbi:MAG: DUF1489 family protein [Rhizobiaceae bacterium]|nr:DUF1489 family protein [Rhizobiaceae bacterium]